VPSREGITTATYLLTYLLIRKACIHLLSVSVAARLIEKGVFEVAGHKLRVLEPPVASHSNPSGTSVYVENVPSAWVKPLERYLENPDNGGGEIIAVKAHDKHVEVTFADARGLCFVLFGVS